MKLNLRGGLRVSLVISPMTEGRYLLASMAKLRKAEQVLDRVVCEDEESVWLKIREMAESRLCEIGIAKMAEAEKKGTG